MQEIDHGAVYAAQRLDNVITIPMCDFLRPRRLEGLVLLEYDNFDELLCEEAEVAALALYSSSVLGIL